MNSSDDIVSGTFLITSGAYAGPEFMSTFGLLPPAFLPVGNQRLYELQAALLVDFSGKKLLSVPEDFELSEEEKNRINKLGFDIIPVPTGLSLGASLAHVMDHAGIGDGELRILHGDTLVNDLPLEQKDIVSEGTTAEYHAWAEYRKTADGSYEYFDGLLDGQSAAPGGERNVLSGYFCFQDAGVFRSALGRAAHAFIPALNAYSQEQPLRPVPTGRWLDFGHLDRYYQARAEVTTERAFNSMDISRRTVRKSSSDQTKMAAESHWFQNLPDPLRVFAPQFLDSFSEGDETGYETEYLYLSPLSDLHIFGRLPTFVWQRIFQSCDDFLVACGAYPPDGGTDTLETLYLEKTLSRLDTFASETGTSLEHPWTVNGSPAPGLLEITKSAAGMIPPATEEHARVMHGDFCFSNIVYDFRANSIRVVDPRGYVHDGTPAIFGDVRYDIAKLHHSVVGGYDTIISGRHRLEDDGASNLSLTLPETPELAERQSVFRERTFAGLSMAEAAAAPIAVLLFLSMLPLHGDRPDRQRAFLANALRLFQDLDA